MVRISVLNDTLKVRTRSISASRHQPWPTRSAFSGFFFRVFAHSKSHFTQAMYNAEKRGKRQVLVRPVSKVVIKFLQVMQKHGKSSVDLSLVNHVSTTSSCSQPILA